MRLHSLESVPGEAIRPALIVGVDVLATDELGGAIGPIDRIQHIADFTIVQLFPVG